MPTPCGALVVVVRPRVSSPVSEDLGTKRRRRRACFPERRPNGPYRLCDLLRSTGALGYDRRLEFGLAWPLGALGWPSSPISLDLHGRGPRKPGTDPDLHDLGTRSTNRTAHLALNGARIDADERRLVQDPLVPVTGPHPVEVPVCLSLLLANLGDRR